MSFPEHPKGSGHDWNEDHIDIGSRVQIQVPVLSCEDCDTWLYYSITEWKTLEKQQSRSDVGLVFIKRNEVNTCSKITSMRLMEATIG